MADTIFTHSTPRDEVLSSNTSISAPGVTDWHRFREGFAIQITGTATSITAQVIRATTFPGENTIAFNPTVPQTSNEILNTLIDYGQPGCLANGVANSQSISGNPSTGIIQLYTEPGCAWWCVNVTAVSGGTVNISLSGKYGG